MTTGPDATPASVLKATATELIPLLTKLSQLSLNSRNEPSDWKQANIVPIFEKGDSSLPDNYRPVAHIHQVQGPGTYHPQQHHEPLPSTPDKLWHPSWCSKEELMGNPTHHHYPWPSTRQLDFSKAFNNVSHRLLLRKLHYFAICDSTLRWIRDFFSSRQQHIVLEGISSFPVVVLSGIPLQAQA